MKEKGVFLRFSASSYEISEASLSTSFQVDSSPGEVPSVFYFLDKSSEMLSIPVDVFNSSMTPLQAAVKYAKEEKGLSNSQIAALLGREVRAVWLTYSAVKKNRLPRSSGFSLSVPLSIFNDERLSALEALSYHLRNLSFSYAQISRMINRDQRTVWTVCSRAEKKLNEVKHEDE